MSRNVAITGAGSGIGLAIAQAFAEYGDRVHIADISAARLEAAQQAIGSDIRTTVADVTDPDAVRSFVESAGADGGLDVFVSNAGIFDGYAGIDETTPTLWDRIIGVNLTGAFYGVKAASDLMIPQRRGRIIIIGSVAGQRGAADGLAYAASKAGLEGMNRRLAIDLAPHGITSNVVAPGVIKTDIRANSAEQLQGIVDVNRGVGATSDMMDAFVPAGRSGEPREIADVVRFLADDSASYLTGQVISVDGGWTAT
ncbi:SDR family NAD(P)-dependent oxidoreductase [Microbacterium sp.]|uniref:SDR family NAD(P)-dependent oxidoreductase n=1 Tax=Microbacterium sp. TaxID=51671 RepID=UPI002811D506|nr:SDR family NAD(P)-dependent oxidoreductase [Microbacterium sp.]